MQRFASQHGDLLVRSALAVQLHMGHGERAGRSGGSHRVSVQYAWPRRSMSCSARMTPRAVPYCAVARLPVLQWVSTRRVFRGAGIAASSAATPCEPIARFAAMSSSSICSAAAMNAAVTDSAVAAASAAARRSCCLSLVAASSKLTAVGRLQGKGAFPRRLDQQVHQQVHTQRSRVRTQNVNGLRPSPA